MRHDQSGSGARGLKFSGHRNLPLILQAESAECGLVCLAMISGYHGRPPNMARLRHMFGVSLKGATLRQIIDIADSMNFAARPLRLELETLSDLQCPCILHWDLNHFVVLNKATKTGIEIYDPAFGKKYLSYAEASLHFTGVALELTPTASFQKRTAVQRMRISDLWRRITGLKRSVGQILLLSVLIQIFALAAPFYSQLVIDEAVTKGDLSFLHVLAIGFLLLLFFDVAVATLRSYVNVHLSNSLSYQMETNLFHHLIRLPAEWFAKRHVGDIASRFDSLEPIKKLITGGIVSAMLDGIMALTTLSMMLLYSWKLTILALSGMALLFIGRLCVFPYVRRKTEEQIQLGAKLESNFLESIRAFYAIKIFAQEQVRQSLWQNSYADVINNSIQLQKFEIKASIGEKVITDGLRVLILYVGATMVIAGNFTLGMLFAFLAYQVHFFEAAQGFINNVLEWRMAGLHLDRIADIADSKKEKGIETHRPNSVPLQGYLELRDVSFRYAEHEPFVFENVSLKIDASECVALIGPSGAGKTTLMKVMLGLLPPTEGVVLVDGQPIEKFGLSAFRRELGVVMQEDQLLSGNISENISFFDPGIDRELMECAAQAACIHDEILDMPMGYESLVGDMGSSLSGGQKQRILLARALYRQPQMLFLDEGTANLDERTEAEINTVLSELSATRIIIAHRSSTIRIATKVVHLEKGQLRIGLRQRGRISPETPPIAKAV